MNKLKKPYAYRIHTGEHDIHGEICLMLLGCTMVGEGKGLVSFVNGKGDKVFTVPQSKVSPLSKKDCVKSAMSEAKIQKEERNAPNN